ncbi:MAG: toll/interleukin-1 receptor domain-containing protein [Niabella sp.]
MLYIKNGILILVVTTVFLFYSSCRCAKKLNQATTDSITEILDTDGDGIEDRNDRCPYEYGTAQLKGCPDTDNDGIADIDDACPTDRGVPEMDGCPLSQSVGSIVKNPPTTASNNPTNNNQSKKAVAKNRNKPENHPQSPELPVNTPPAQASLAYAYKNCMLKGSTMEISIKVRLDKPVNDVQSVLKIEYEKKTIRQDSCESIITDTITIVADRYLRIIPFGYDTTIFKIDSLNPLTQELKYGYSTDWRWTVLAIKETPQSNIHLQIFAIDSNGIKHFRNNAIVNVAVKSNSRFTNWWIFLLPLAVLPFTIIFIKWQKKRRMKLAIYFSYAWDQQEELIDDLYKSMQKTGFNVVKDKEDLRLKGMISEYMTKMGEAKFIIIGISDKYLKSRFCMFELYEIYRNSKMNKEEFVKKIFPLRLENINLGESDVVKGYIQYWEKVEAQWDKDIKEESDNITQEQSRQYHIIKQIITELSRILIILADIKTLNVHESSKDDFLEIKNAIRKELRQ